MPKIFLRHSRNERYRAIDIYDILSLEAQSNYTKVITELEEWIYSITLNDFFVKLQRADTDRKFVRIGRSAVVNKDRVTEIEGNMLSIGARKYTIPRQMRDEVLAHFNIF